MTAIRLIPFPVRAALQLLLGLAVMIVPFGADFAPTAACTAVVIGAVMVGISLSGVVDERGRTALPLSTLHAFDHGLALVLLTAGVTIGALGDARAAVILAALAAAQSLLALTTRYSLPS